MDNMIRLARPNIDDKTIEQVNLVLKSGNLVQGSCVQKLEEKVQNYTNAKYARMVSSGTAALHVALCALKINSQDEIIVPAFTFPATANVVELCGAKPVFADIRLDNFCIDEQLIESLITPRTKAIIPVHEFGTPAAIDKIYDIAKKHNLYVVEDAACSLGACLNNKHTGTWGEFGCFSFHPRKSITTGEGGVLVFNDEKMLATVESLRNHGMADGDFVLPGFNYRMTDFQAALGLGQFEQMDDIVEHNNVLAALYSNELADCSWITTPAKTAGAVQTFQTYHILLDEKTNQTELKNFLLQKGIQSNIGAHALAALCFYKTKYNLREKDFPNAQKAYRSGLALPLGTHLNHDDVKFVCNQLKSFTS